MSLHDQLDFSGAPANFESVCHTVNRGVPSLNLVGSHRVVGAGDTYCLYCPASWILSRCSLANSNLWRTSQRRTHPARGLLTCGFSVAGEARTICQRNGNFRLKNNNFQDDRRSTVCPDSPGCSRGLAVDSWVNLLAATVDATAPGEQLPFARKASICHLFFCRLRPTSVSLASLSLGRCGWCCSWLAVPAIAQPPETPPSLAPVTLLLCHRPRPSLSQAAPVKSPRLRMCEAARVALLQSEVPKPPAAGLRPRPLYGQIPPTPILRPLTPSFSSLLTTTPYPSRHRITFPVHGRRRHIIFARDASLRSPFAVGKRPPRPDTFPRLTPLPPQA